MRNSATTWSCEADALVARGMAPEAARDAARQHFGSVALVKDDCRESWGMRAIDVMTAGRPLRAPQPAKVSRPTPPSSC